jgi:hypothetical protein
MRAVLSCIVAMLFALCLVAQPADAAVHPNQKKIGKWNAQIAKIQGKIDHENTRVQLVSMVEQGIRVSVPYTVQLLPNVESPPVASLPATTVIHRHRIRTWTYIFH